VRRARRAYASARRSYRGSRPVRVGNGAIAQRQHDIYGGLLETAWLYSERHDTIDGDTGQVLGRIADRVCDIWRQPDSGIWEVRQRTLPFHPLQGDVLGRARPPPPGWASAASFRRGVSSAGGAKRPRFAPSSSTECWSSELRSYTRIAGSRDVDASLLMMPLMQFDDARGERMQGTIDAVRRLLQRGDFVYRYLADDGIAGGEGCFVNGSFWLVSALARSGRVDEASALMERAVRAGERRWSLRRGNRSTKRGVPRQLSAGARAPRADRRGDFHQGCVVTAAVIWSAVAGGFLGTLALTTIVRAASEFGLTRMDLPLLLGTTLTENRRKARAIGYAIHFVVGPVFAVGYAALFHRARASLVADGRCWGALHAVFTGTVLVNIIHAAAAPANRDERTPPRTTSA
jgi:hypothetical protein